MAKATTTTYLEIESIGADKLVSTMDGLRKSLSFVAGQLKDLNKGLGISSSKAKEGAQAIDEQGKAAAEAAQSVTQLRLAMAAQNSAIADITASVSKMAKANEDAKKKGIDWTQLKSKLDLAKQAYSLVESELTGLFTEGMRVAKAWETQEQAELRLQAALKAGGITESIDDFKAWAGAVQNATVYGDEYVLSLASQAARFGGTSEQTKRATQSVLDWASATGRDAAQGIQALGNAMAGSAKGLQSMGIYLSDTEQEWLKNAKEAERLEFVLQKLEGSYKGFSEALATTPTGALTQAQNILGDIDEQVGRLVSPGLYVGLSVVKDYLQGQLDSILEITDDAQKLDSIQRDILAGLGAAAATIIDIKTGVTILKNSVEVLADVVLMTIGAPLKMLAPVFNGLARIPGLADGAKKALHGVASGLAATYDQSASGIMDDVGDIKRAIAEAEKQKDQVWASLEAYDQKHREGTKARGQAAGVAGGGLDAELKAELERYKQQVAALEAEKARLKAEAKAAAEARQAAKAQKGYEAANPLDAEMTAYLDHEQAMLAAQADFAAKRRAIEQSTLIDYQSKLDYKKELDTQEQEALRQLKLDYAKATGDELTIIEDTYRQERMTKEKAAAEELAAQQKATMETLASNIKSVTGLGVDMLTSWIEGTGDWRAQLYDALKSFSVNLMKTSIASIIDQALVNQSKAQGSQAGIPIIGPVLALAAGAAMFATTMALKSKLKPADVQYAQGGYISAGLVRGGAWGRDSVSALLRPGERVLSKKEAKAYDEGKTTSQNVVININVSGQLSTPEQTRDTVRRVLLPELNAALRGGYRLAV